MKTAEEWAHECYDDNAGQYEDATLSYGQYAALIKRIQRDALESAMEYCRAEADESSSICSDEGEEAANSIARGIKKLMPEEP